MQVNLDQGAGAAYRINWECRWSMVAEWSDRRGAGMVTHRGVGRVMSSDFFDFNNGYTWFVTRAELCAAPPGTGGNDFEVV